MPVIVSFSPFVENKFGKLFVSKEIKVFHILGDKVKFLVNLAEDLTAENPKDREYAKKTFQLLREYEEL